MLRFLLFSIGIDMVKGGVSLKSSLVRPETFYLPVGVIIGSLLGVLPLAFIFELDVGKSLAVASGFGWYSLSGVLITDMGDPILGSAAFVSNILREHNRPDDNSPYQPQPLSPYRHRHSRRGQSMDVSLPLIERSCGPESVPLSITSGVILSLLVPVLVPLLYNL